MTLIVFNFSKICPGDICHATTPFVMVANFSRKLSEIVSENLKFHNCIILEIMNLLPFKIMFSMIIVFLCIAALNFGTTKGMKYERYKYILMLNAISLNLPYKVIIKNYHYLFTDEIKMQLFAFI